MLEVGARFIDPRDGIKSCGGAAAEASELRENEPHPVALLRSGAELSQDDFEDAMLRVDEALKVVRIGRGHADVMRFARTAWKGSWRLLARRQQPRQEIEDNHNRARQQRGRDKG